MKNTSTATDNHLGFMTIWTIGWSIGTAALASTVDGAGFFMFMIFSAIQLVAWWAFMKIYVDVAKTMFEVPDLKQDLNSMSATWGSKSHLWWLLLWCFSVGAVVLAVLLFGTWMPALGAETIRMVIPTISTGLWSYMGWKWLQAIWQMLSMKETFSLESTFEHLSIKSKKLLFQRDIELPIFGMTLTADDTAIHIRAGDEDVTMLCPPSPERERLIDNLNQSIQRAVSDPVTQPEVPQAIAEMLGQKS